MRVVKDALILGAMCERLKDLVNHLYGGDTELVVQIMRYKSDTTLRKALANQSSFPDVERLHLLALIPQAGIAIPNMNWLLNGLELPLLEVRKGKIIGQLSFGQFVDRAHQRSRPEI